jgi:hypothetical protein
MRSEGMTFFTTGESDGCSASTRLSPLPLRVLIEHERRPVEDPSRFRRPTHISGLMIFLDLPVSALIKRTDGRSCVHATSALYGKHLN